MEFYNKNIQIHPNVIIDIFYNFQNQEKVLVFGLGHDSKMWYNHNQNTYFVENNQKYIDLNRGDIPESHIVYYDYSDITVRDSFEMTDQEIEKYKIPEKIKALAPFDVIIIDGPEGWNSTKPGRLLPLYWSYKYLSKTGTTIYVDDYNRKLENYCVNRYFKDDIRKIFQERDKCCKIVRSKGL